MLDEMEELRKNLKETNSNIEKEISKVSSSFTQSSENVLNIYYLDGKADRRLE
jgi:hypothetical protein